MTAGASKAAPTTIQQPALAPSPQPRPAPTGRALPPNLDAQGGQNWTPIRGQIWAPIDKEVKLRIEPTRRYAGRQSPETSDDFRLADGRLLWYAFLNDPNALVMAATDANRARGELR